MDFEELQLAWTQMGEELETQKKLTKSIILERMYIYEKYCMERKYQYKKYCMGEKVFR